MFSIILATALTCGPTEIQAPKGYEVTEQDLKMIEYGRSVGCLNATGLPCLVKVRITANPDGSAHYDAICDLPPAPQEPVQEKG